MPYSTVIVAGRRMGKTTTLVQAALDDPDGVIVVANYARARAIERDMPQAKGRVVTIGSAEGFESVRRLPGTYRFYFDDVETILSQLFWHHAASMTTSAIPAAPITGRLR